MQKFLVIQTAFIGDVVLATGLIEKLHAHFPEAQIDFMVRKGNEALLANHPYLHRLLVWDKKKNKIINLWRMLQQVRREKYDKVINVQRFAATGLLTAFSGATETIGFDKNPLSRFFTHKIPHVIAAGDQPRHEIERNNDLVKHFTDGSAMRPRLYPSEADYAAIRPHIVPPYICIAPASVWFTKQYPPEKWTSFINRIPTSTTIYLLGAPGDQVLCERVRSAAHRASVINLCGRLNFLQSAALQQSALMNYVNDSAPMHFASAMNAPVTAVYCSTLPSFGFGPLSDKSFIVERLEPLYCRPCGLHGHKACPQGHFKCAHDIKDEQLLRSLGQ
jgi:heptosyltransferase II